MWAGALVATKVLGGITKMTITKEEALKMAKELGLTEEDFDEEELELLIEEATT